MHGDFGYFDEDQLGKSYDIGLLKRLLPFARPYGLFLACAIFLVVFITVIEIGIPYLTKIAVDRYIVPQIGKTKFETEGNVRYLNVDMADDDVKHIVNRHPELFNVDEDGAEIAYHDLKQLDSADLFVLRKNDVRGVGLIALILFLIVVVNFALNFLQVLVMEYSGQRMIHDLRMRLFSHILELSISFFNRHSVGRLVTRVTNDIQNMHDLFTSVIVFLFRDLFLLIGIMIVLLFIHWQLALISFMVLPLVVYASIYFANKARNVFRILRIKLAEINTRFSETIGGIKVIQMFNQERGNYDSFKKLNHENYLEGMRQIHVFALFMPVIEFFGAVSVAIVIYFGGVGILAETISLGAFVAYISYMKMFFNPIRDIAEKYNIIQNAMASAERVFLILDNDDKMPGLICGEKEIDHIESVEFENVSFAYREGETVLKDISLMLQPGRTLAVVGPTGSGKTTLINLLTRFYDPQEGRILLNGKNLMDYDIFAVRSKIALVTQDPFLFTGTIRANIVHGNPDVPPDKMKDILEKANCTYLIKRLSKGLDTVLGEGGLSISSGERQLISIARAFARDPDLIILDEATSYIDSETEVKIQAALSNLMQHRTSVIVAHRLSTARHAEKILVLHKGSIIESGNHEDLMRRRGFYYKLNKVQS